MPTYDYNDLEFTTKHEDCAECEKMLALAYSAFKQVDGWSDVSTGDADHFGEVAILGRGRQRV